MNKKSKSVKPRIKRLPRIRKKIASSSGRNRLVVNKSNKYIRVQIIDDNKHITVIYDEIAGKNIASAKKLGAKLAVAAKKKKISSLVFDRSGYKFHGAVRALADSVKEGGIKI